MRNHRHVDVAELFDDLARLCFSVDVSGLSARGITARLTREIVAWSLANGWSTKTEARVVLSAPGQRIRDYGYIDVIVKRGDGAPDVAIEIDQTDKPRSVAKLQYVMSLGMEAVWIRWSGAEWTDVEGVHVIHMPEVQKEPAPRLAPAQLSFW